MLKARVARTPRDAMSAAAVLLVCALALALGALALAGCGESAEEKAHAQVCDARKAISAQVTKLQGLTLSSSSVDQAKSGIESIGAELKKIRDAQPDLAPNRKQEVETATSKFGEELKSVGVQVASALPSGTSEAAIAAAKPKLKAAAEALASDYRQALGPVSC